ncbi:MAG: OmpA family protein, partial [Primorskyibacter sp.]
AELEAQIARLMDLLAEAQTAQAALRARLSDAEATDRDRAAAFEAQIARLQALLADARDARRALQTQLTDTQSEGATLAARLRNDLASVAQENSALGDANTALQDALNDTLAAKALLEEQLARLDARRLAELAELRQTLEIAQSDAAQLRADLSAARRAQEAAAADLARQTSRLTNLEAALAKALLRSEEQDRDAVQSQEDRADLRAANAALAEDLTMAQVALAEAKQALAALRTDTDQAVARLQSQVQADASRMDALQTELVARNSELARAEARQAEAERQRDLARAEVLALTSQSEADTRSLEEKLATALATQKQADQDLAQVRDDLAAALAAQRAAEDDLANRLSKEDARAALLATAQAELSKEKAISAEALRKTEVLNQQVAALRSQLDAIQGLLDESRMKDLASQVQIQNLGSELNAAIGKIAIEERQRRILEEEARRRAEAELRQLSGYRSEFFGRMRDILAGVDGVRIEGDRFIFDNSVLFASGQADVSLAGINEIAKVARTLAAVIDDIPAEIDWIIRVDGHTDDRPITGGRYFDNWELSQARARSVMLQLARFGIPFERMSANGFGEFQPVDNADTAEARARNRRIELKLTER